VGRGDRAHDDAAGRLRDLFVFMLDFHFDEAHCCGVLRGEGKEEKIGGGV
jgi:hypothetical protein